VNTGATAPTAHSTPAARPIETYRGDIVHGTAKTAEVVCKHTSYNVTVALADTA
jgi:hypothetical protein